MVALSTFRPRPARSSRVLQFVIGALAALTLAACGSTSTTSVGPTPTRCELTLSAAPNPVPSAGGAVNIAVTAAPECAWTATENVAWLSQMTPASGQGTSQITVQAAANNTLAARQDTVTVNGVNQIIRQDAGTCSHQLGAVSTTVTADAQTVTVTVTVTTGCPWTAVSNTPFVTVASGASGNATGTVTLNVAANPAAPSRQGTVTIAGQTFTVTQGGANCTYNVTPLAQSFGSQGGPGSASVTSPDGCAWSATAGQGSFVTITSGATGSGTGTVGFSVNANPTLSPRQTTLTIAGRAFTVTQDALTCTFSLSPGSYNAPASGASDTVTVTTPPVCEWSISSNVPWLTFSGSNRRTGSSGVAFNVQANAAGIAREGSLTIGDQLFTVTQDGAPCDFSISPTSQNFPSANAANGNPIQVTGPPGCDWTAGSNNGFITVTSGESGTGNGTVTFAVSANGNINARTGTITIAGQTFTVNQAGIACSFTINPASQNVGAGASTGTTNVTAPAGCNWTAQSNIGFITVTGGAQGSGDGQVSFSIAANPFATARQGTLTIAGQTFTVNQAGAACTYQINPTSLNAGSAGVTGSSFTVTTLAGCAWNATLGPNSAFISITSGSGNGPGTVTFNVQTNSGPARSGTIVVQGQTFTVNQASGCTYTIPKISLSFTADGGTGAAGVMTQVGCPWSASSNQTWVTIAPSSGTGSSSPSITVGANTGAARSATLTFTGQNFTQSFTLQQAAPCTFTLMPTSRTHPNSLVATTGTVTVSTGPTCSWNAVVASNPSMLSIVGSGSGLGPGTVTYSVGPQLLGTRTGTLNIGGQIFTVTQGP